MRAVVHDTLVIVADAIIGDSAIVILVEVMLLTYKFIEMQFTHDTQERPSQEADIVVT